MCTEAEILNSSRVVAVVGLSPKPDRPSYNVANYLKGNGYKITPVNPEVGEILGEACYPDLSSIPEPVDVTDIFRRSEEVPAIVEAAIKIKAKAVWMQEGVINEKAAAKSEHMGKTYYFCAPGCKKAFVENPQKYLKEEPKQTHRYC